MTVACPSCSKNYAAGVARCPFCNTPNPDAAPHVAAAMVGAGKGAATGAGEPRLVDLPPSPVLAALHEESVALATEAPPPAGPVQEAVARFAAWPAERRATIVIFAMAALTLLDAPILLLDHFRAAASVSLWLPALALLVAASLTIFARGESCGRPRVLWFALGCYLVEFAFTQSPLPVILVLLKLIPALLLVKFAVEATAAKWVEEKGGE